MQFQEFSRKCASRWKAMLRAMRMAMVMVTVMVMICLQVEDYDGAREVVVQPDG